MISTVSPELRRRRVASPRVLCWLRTEGSTRHRVAAAIGEGVGLAEPRDQVRALLGVASEAALDSLTNLWIGP